VAVIPEFGREWIARGVAQQLGLSVTEGRVSTVAVTLVEGCFQARLLRYLIYFCLRVSS
jgi:hypothetical protein